MTMGETATRCLLAQIAVGGLIAAAWLTSARAHADTLDELYVENLHEVGIYSGQGDAGMIALGHTVCNAFGIGESFTDVGTLILSNNPKLNSTGAAQIIGAATAAYCPSYTWKFGGTPSTSSAPRGTGVVA